MRHGHDPDSPPDSRPGTLVVDTNIIYSLDTMTQHGGGLALGRNDMGHHRSGS
jgi:hypothetical protein